MEGLGLVIGTQFANQIIGYTRRRLRLPRYDASQTKCCASVLGSLKANCASGGLPITESASAECMVPAEVHQRVTLLRRSLVQLPAVQAMEALVQRLGKSESNAAFLDKIGAFVK